MAGGLILVLWLKVQQLESLVQLLSALSEVPAILKAFYGPLEYYRDPDYEPDPDASPSELEEDGSYKKSRYLRAGSKDEVSDDELWEKHNNPRDPPHLAELRGCVRARRAKLEEEWDKALDSDNRALRYHIENEIRMIDCLDF